MLKKLMFTKDLQQTSGVAGKQILPFFIQQHMVDTELMKP